VAVDLFFGLYGEAVAGSFDFDESYGGDVVVEEFDVLVGDFRVFCAP
jgi:hypothetical protein